MARKTATALLVAVALAATVSAQLLESEPVFGVRLLADREPAVAGDALRLAVVLSVDEGWHVGSDEPGDELSLPTTLEWTLPEGWPEPAVGFPDGERIRFSFSSTPIEVWEGEVVILARLRVPPGAASPASVAATVTAQACNDTECLPPTAVPASVELEVAPPGSEQREVNGELFAAAESAGERSAGGGDEDRFGGKALPLLLLTVFVAGLALNLTPCVYPLIPITVGFFAQQAKERGGKTFGLAVLYVLGMSVTYSTLGVVAALTGQLFGAALRSPIVVGGIVVVILALAASMFGLWELRVPGWAMRASGGRQGMLGALLMGLVVGFVAAPCIGPFVLGLLTYVGQQGSPLLGFVLFFTLAIGLGLPYLLLGTFTGAASRLPASGVWMVGVRKVFGVLLVALAAYFAAPLLPSEVGNWLIAAALLAGGAYLLLVERPGHEQPVVDRVMRALALVLIVAGVVQLPARAGGGRAEGLEWLPYEAAAVEAAVASSQPVIIDFYADWCAPCKELDEKTFADPRVAEALAGYARFKADQTKASPEGDAAAAAWKVRGMPTVIVLEDGVERFRITGFEPPERFLKRLAAVGGGG